MDFEHLLKKSWDHYVRGLVKLVLFVLVGCLLCITIILIPTVTAGWTRGILAYIREGKDPQFEELWNFEDYFQILVLIVACGVLITIGYMLLVIPGIILSVIWLYSLLFLVDKKLDFLDAMKASKDAVVKTGFFYHFVVVLIIALLNSIGGVAGGIGALFTTPFTLVLLTVTYIELIEPRRLTGH